MPIIPSTISQTGRLPSACWIRVTRLSVPPSPRLSARMISATYLKLTIEISVQISSEITPTTSSGDSPSRDAACSDSRIA